MLWCGCKGRRDQLVEGLIMELPPDLIDNDLGETPDSREKALVELKEELKSAFAEESYGYWIDLRLNIVFRVEQITATLTEEKALKYPDLVDNADRKEVEQFVKYKVF